MKQASVSCLGLLMLLASTSATVAEDGSVPPSTPRRVRLEFCKITLIDRVMLAADRTGILKSMEFKEGQSVASGAQVALIADEVAAATLAVAERKATKEEEVDGAKKMWDLAKKEWERLQKANENATGARPVSALDIDKSELAMAKAELTYVQAKHEMEVNVMDRNVKAAELKTYSVFAPFEGKLIQVMKKRGEAVRQGDPIAEIVNLDRVRIDGRVKSSDLKYAKEGAKVIVRLSIEDRDEPEEQEVFEGKITFVDLVSDPIAKTTRIFAEVQNRDNILRGGYDAVMEILAEEPAAPNTASASKQKSSR